MIELPSDLHDAKTDYNNQQPEAVDSATTPDVGSWHKLLNFISQECTFYRVHLAAFTFIPLIASGVFYGSNGEFRVRYLDSLFLCYSAMTVTGLTTVNLSTLTAWQQVMLYLLMIVGDITTISWITVLVRKRFFRNHCEYIVSEQLKRRRQRHIRRSRSSLIRSIAAPMHIQHKSSRKASSPSAPAIIEDVVGTDHGARAALEMADSPATTTTRPMPSATSTKEGPGLTLDTTDLARHDQGQKGIDSASNNGNVLLADDIRWTSSPTQNPHLTFPSLADKSPHIEFAISSAVPSRGEGRYWRSADAQGKSGVPNAVYPDQGSRRTPTTLPGTPFASAASGANRFPTFGGDKYRGSDELSGPFRLVHRLAKSAAPNTYRKFQRSITIPSTRTLEQRNTAYLNFDLNTGRNSDFHTESLSDEQLEILGGTEYKALRWLSYVVPLYFILTQLLAFVIFAPWLSTMARYDGVFEAQPRLVNKTWFSLFQTMAAYTGGGLSLVDLNMLPFQTAYLMIFPLTFVILAGNHALPVLLRFVIWTCSKVMSKESQSYATLCFLLDHPRRCFLYLFPSHQTWFLLISLIVFSAIEWVSFVVLNDGLSVYESLPIGVRVVSGLFQGIAARASGFSIVPLASFAPALLFLYVVMMYIAVYPVALSIRSTNVYEERSLGVYEIPPEHEQEEPQGLEKIPDRRERIGKYLYWHLRRQMSIDIWWLVWAVFFIAIVERNSLLDEEKKWFDLFRIIFEVVSAFGGIGLSLGFPSDNYSFVGAMRPLSKLIVIIIMVRGRHRGLPVAVDRAIVLPRDMITRRNTVNGQSEKGAAMAEPQPLYSDFGA